MQPLQGIAPQQMVWKAVQQLTADAGDLATASVAARVHTAATSPRDSGCMNGMLPARSRMLQGEGREEEVIAGVRISGVHSHAGRSMAAAAPHQV